MSYFSSPPQDKKSILLKPKLSKAFTTNIQWKSAIVQVLVYPNGHQTHNFKFSLLLKSETRENALDCGIFVHTIFEVTKFFKMLRKNVGRFFKNVSIF